MTKMKLTHAKKYVLAFGFLLLAFNTTLAQKAPTLDFFHGRECPHCQEQKAWLPVLEVMYPDVEINEYEVWHNTANQKLWGDRLAEFGMSPSAVPTNIIGDEVIVGFNKAGILQAMADNFGPPAVAEADIDVAEVTAAEDDGLKKIIFVIFGALVLVGAVFLFSPKK